MGTIFWVEGYHRGVTVGDWGVTMGVVFTVVVITVGERNITVGTLVVTVEVGLFVTVVGAWWGVFAVQGGQT